MKLSKKVKKENKKELLELLITYGGTVILILYGYFVWLMFFATER